MALRANWSPVVIICIANGFHTSCEDCRRSGNSVARHQHYLQANRGRLEAEHNNQVNAKEDAYRSIEKRGGEKRGRIESTMFY